MAASGTVQRDIRYAAQRALLELDGSFGHRDTVDRWADLQRDLDATIGGHLTLRAGATCGDGCSVDSGAPGRT